MTIDDVAIIKSSALEAFDGNASALARALGISPQAIYQWPEGAIPEVHALKLRYVLRPSHAWASDAQASQDAPHA